MFPANPDGASDTTVAPVAPAGKSGEWSVAASIAASEFPQMDTQRKEQQEAAGADDGFITRHRRKSSRRNHRFASQAAAQPEPQLEELEEPRDHPLTDSLIRKFEQATASADVASPQGGKPMQPEAEPTESVVSASEYMSLWRRRAGESFDDRF